MAEADCEKSVQPRVSPLEIHKTHLLLFSSVLNQYLEYIEKNKEAYMNATSEENVLAIMKFMKAKVRKKRGPKGRVKHDYSEQNKVREVLFEEFMAKYPIQERAAAALKLWLRIPNLESIFPAIMKTLEWQIAAWNQGETKFIPSPVKYILDKRWNDKPREPVTKKPKSAFGDLNFPAN